jgi:hypothetical protein
MKAAVPERGRGFVISGNIGDSLCPLDERCEMDADLRIHLEAMDARFDGIDSRFEAMEERFKTHVSVECEKIETKLLNEFYK